MNEYRKLQLSRMLLCLLELQNGRIEGEDFGICSNLRWTMQGYGWIDYYSIKVLQRYMKHWPKHSGDNDYPVPSPLVQWSACEYYYERSADHWLKGQYADDRKDLLAFIIQGIERDLK